MADVFISYSRADVEKAQQIRVRIEKLGLTTFFDIEGGINPGDTFPMKIADEIRRSKAVLALWTPRALQSEWCRRECFQAQKLGRLVPVAIAPLDAIDLGEFSDVSYEDLTDLELSDEHFGWNQALLYISGLLTKWVDSNPGDIEGERIKKLAAQVRAVAEKNRPSKPASKGAGRNKAATIWDRDQLAKSTNQKDLDNFARAFPGTPEAYEALKRIKALREETAKVVGDVAASAATGIFRLLPRALATAAVLYWSWLIWNEATFAVANDRAYFFVEDANGVFSLESLVAWYRANHEQNVFFGFADGVVHGLTFFGHFEGGVSWFYSWIIQPALWCCQLLILGWFTDADRATAFGLLLAWIAMFLNFYKYEEPAVRFWGNAFFLTVGFGLIVRFAIVPAEWVFHQTPGKVFGLAWQFLMSIGRGG